MREITITANDAGRRLDRFLRKYLKSASLGEIYKFIRKDVKVGGRRQSESYVLNEGDILSLYLSDDVLDALTGSHYDLKDASGQRNFDLVYEDDQILIANKPYGLLTHGDRYERKDHLANRVKDYLIASGAYNPRTEKVFTPAPVNRLDRNTTGIVLFGKTSGAMRELTRMIRENVIRKYYLTIALGDITDELHLNGTLIKDDDANKVRVYHPDRQSALSRGGRIDEEFLPEKARSIETIARPLGAMTFGQGFTATLCEVELVTGRSHQIRAHLSAAGHPLAGDSKYALRKYKKTSDYLKKEFGLSTQLLHAYRIEFSDAAAGYDCLGYLSEKTFQSDPPKRFDDIRSELGALPIIGKS